MTEKPLIFDLSEKKESFQNQVRNLLWIDAPLSRLGMDEALAEGLLLQGKTIHPTFRNKDRGRLFFTFRSVKAVDFYAKNDAKREMC